jgi:hypothetical protein
MNPLTQAVTTAATLKAIDKSNDPKVEKVRQNPASFKEAFLARPFTWTLVIGLGAFVGYRIFKGVAKGLGPKPPKTEKEVLDEVRNLQKNLRATYADSQYPGFADAIYAARHGNRVLGTDEDAIWRVLAMMKNDLDFAKLVQAFGMRRLSFQTTKADLIGFLNDEMNPEEIATCNSILAGNGITYKV